LKSGCKKPFKAKVFSGLGEGEFYVSIYSRGFRVKLGITPYPGTLNARLIDEDVDEFNKCLNSVDGVKIDPPPIPNAKLAPVIVYPAHLNGYPVWIVRPMITVYKRDVVELIADVRLRDLLGLSDGSIIEIYLRDE